MISKTPTPKNPFCDADEWYHPIDLKQPGLPPVQCGRRELWAPMWNQVRAVRKGISYQGKSVLDLASADGMWAFEAEDLGASKVVAVDVGPPGLLERLLYARACRNSKVIPYYSVCAERLYQHLEPYFTLHTGGKRFDIIQNLGVFYHVRDLFLCLSQCRKCIVEGGSMLLEGALFFDDNKHPVCVLNENRLFYDDESSWWAPNKKCLFGMLRTSLFEPVESSFKSFHEQGIVGRFCVIAKAVGPKTLSPLLVRELGLQYLT